MPFQLKDDMYLCPQPQSLSSEKKLVLEQQLVKQVKFSGFILLRIYSHSLVYIFSTPKIVPMKTPCTIFIFNPKFVKFVSDCRVVRASASGAVDSGLIPSRVEPMT